MAIFNMPLPLELKKGTWKVGCVKSVINGFVRVSLSAQAVYYCLYKKLFSKYTIAHYITVNGFRY